MKNGGTVKISLPDLGVRNFGAELRAVLIMDLWLDGVTAAKLLIGQRRCEILLFFRNIRIDIMKRSIYFIL